MFLREDKAIFLAVHFDWFDGNHFADQGREIPRHVTAELGGWHKAAQALPFHDHATAIELYSFDLDLSFVSQVVVEHIPEFVVHRASE